MCDSTSTRSTERLSPVEPIAPPLKVTGSMPLPAAVIWLMGWERCAMA
jgi:hypothetical protein